MTTVATHCKRGHPRPEGYRPGDNCNPCAALRTAKYVSTHAEEHKARVAAWRARNIGYFRLYREKKKRASEIDARQFPNIGRLRPPDRCPTCRLADCYS